MVRRASPPGAKMRRATPRGGRAPDATYPPGGSANRALATYRSLDAASARKWTTAPSCETVERMPVSDMATGPM